MGVYGDYFSRYDLEVTPLDRYWRKMAQTTWVHAQMCILELKTKVFETPDPQTPKTAEICPILFWSGFRKFSLDFAFNIGSQE